MYYDFDDETSRSLRKFGDIGKKSQAEKQRLARVQAETAVAVVAPPATIWTAVL